MSGTGPAGPRTRRPVWIIPALAGGSALVVAVAVGVGYTVLADEEPARPSGGPATPARSAPATPSAGPEFFSADTPELTALPDACAAVTPGTLQRLVPGAEMSRQVTPVQPGKPGRGICTWRLVGKKSRTLDVFLVLLASGRTLNGAKGSARAMDRLWKQAKQGPGTKGISGISARRINLGSEAFSSYRVYRGTTGELSMANVTVRVRNVTIEVKYSGSDNPSDKLFDYSDEKALSKTVATQGALQVAQEIVPRVVNQA